ncbi:MAG TPA: hypothetical protein DIT99_21445 [Candidatus Latescibacteria bacterium]|nr:hypothetical protein [Candidatus Latescibacterota bacterium]
MWFESYLLRSIVFLFSLSVQAQESVLVQIKNLNIEYNLARKAVFDAGENPGALSYSSCRHASDQ